MITEIIVALKGRNLFENGVSLSTNNFEWFGLSVCHCELRNSHTYLSIQSTFFNLIYLENGIHHGCGDLRQLRRILDRPASHCRLACGTARSSRRSDERSEAKSGDCCCLASDVRGSLRLARVERTNASETISSGARIRDDR